MWFYVPFSTFQSQQQKSKNVFQKDIGETVGLIGKVFELAKVERDHNKYYKPLHI